MLLLIDNFDSFTYNLVQSFQVLGANVNVVRNDRISIDESQDLNPQYLVISPGPGEPCHAGISNAMIERWAGIIPILGVCLGHQCIGKVYGGKIVKAQQPMHGKTSKIYHDSRGVFEGLPQGFIATRYHSLIIERNSLPSCLEITAETKEGEIMGVRHRECWMEGVQFHPESVLTEAGMDLMQNFIQVSCNDQYVVNQ